ncbi:MAG TPA: tryptophan synthase subunit alpha [Phycisphaerales bacterium]|nr:tryptophan synthase subunit alpha [Phycisphaerales bacterium]
MTEANTTNRIDSVFGEHRRANTRALMPFVVGGHPSIGCLPELLCAIDEAGGSVIEIGFPFSDPIADGPVISAAMHGALQHDVTPSDIFREIERVRADVRAGLVAMISVSMVHRLGGPAGFAERAASAGFDGCIVPDVPLEESEPFIEACRCAGLAMSLLIAPTTPEERAEKIAQRCTGFVYLLARSGITGETAGPPEVATRIERLRRVTDLPIAVGFGISNPGHVRAVVAHADAAIVGSALIRRIDDAVQTGQDPALEAKAFVGTLVQGLHLR